MSATAASDLSHHIRQDDAVKEVPQVPERFSLFPVECCAAHSAGHTDLYGGFVRTFQIYNLDERYQLLAISYIIADQYHGPVQRFRQQGQ